MNKKEFIFPLSEEMVIGLQSGLLTVSMENIGPDSGNENYDLEDI